MTIDPIHQFNIQPLFTIGHIGNQTIAFTNSSLYMFLAVALTALELLVAFLQAYVFAILTCIYLNDAIHPGH